MMGRPYMWERYLSRASRQRNVKNIGIGIQMHLGV